jgi:hypothetical protein
MYIIATIFNFYKILKTRLRERYRLFVKGYKYFIKSGRNFKNFNTLYKTTAKAIIISTGWISTIEKEPRCYYRRETLSLK